jgi:hypothetical protein
MENRFYWDSDTLDYFAEQSIKKTKTEVLSNVKEFVKLDCSLEEGETEEMLVEDLINKIYNKIQ